MRPKKLDNDELVGQITRLQNLKKDYELVKNEAEEELQLMRQYQSNSNEEIVEKAVEGEKRALKVVDYYNKKISEVDQEIGNFIKARNN